MGLKIGQKRDLKMMVFSSVFSFVNRLKRSSATPPKTAENGDLTAEDAEGTGGGGERALSLHSKKQERLNNPSPVTAFFGTSAVKS
jgi:hypothetical protein